MATKILTASHPAFTGAPLRVAPAIGSEFNLVRAFLIPNACFRFEDAHFAFDSSFIAPDAVDIGPLKALLDQHPGSKLSIFGHADPTGDDVYNKRLSGRRALAVLGLLTRDVALWKKLNDQPAGGDVWKPKAEQTMHATTGLPAGTPTDVLIKAYMDHLCTQRDAAGQPINDAAGAPIVVELTAADLLARGAGPNHKGDAQGCGEFNPLMVFSKDEKANLDRPENHVERNRQNQVNRRVMVLLFRPGSLVDPARWPCPNVDEGVGGCIKRFHSDGEKRRSNQAEHREFKDSKDTFACRLYDRVSNNSPCEVPVDPPIVFTVASLQATLESTKNAASAARPAAGSFKTTNAALDFAAPTNDLLVVVQGAGEITVTALGVNPPSQKKNVRWQIDRDPTDSVATDLPALDTNSGDVVKVTPGTAGSFRLICMRDANEDGKHQPGEELRVLRLAIVRITAQPGASMTAGQTFTGKATGVATGPSPNAMTLQADFLLEGGGATRQSGVAQVHLGNVGNLQGDTFVVSYPGQPAPKDTRDGTEEEDPDFLINPAAGFASPMVDAFPITHGKEPTGGNTPNRSHSVDAVQGNGPGGNGQLRRVTSSDRPAFGWDANHPKTHNVWASTAGTNEFREWIVAHTDTFPRNYTALGRGDWTVTAIGTRSAAGIWTDNGSSVTLPAAWTSTGFPQTGDASGVQVLGHSFVHEFGMIVKP